MHEEFFGDEYCYPEPYAASMCGGLGSHTMSDAAHYAGVSGGEAILAP